MDDLRHQRAAVASQLRSLASAHSLRWAFLRLDHFERFVLGHGDLDILVDNADDAGASITDELGRPSYILRRSYVTSFCYPWGHIDIHDHLGWRGLDYLSSAQALTEAVSHNGIPTLSATHQAVHCLLSSLLWGGFVKDSYKDLIHDVSGSHSKEMRTLLNSVFGPLYGNFIFSSCTNDDWKSLEASVGEIRTAMLKRKPLLKRIGKQLVYFIQEGRLLLSAKTPTVAFFGPDGVGKSTSIRALSQEAAGVFSGIQIFHWRPGLLPDFGVLLRKRRKHSGVCSTPHGQTPHRTVVSTIRFCYYLCDYLLGWFTLVARARAQNKLVVFDRYFHDFLVDPYRYRLSLPPWILRFVSKFIPKPSLAIILSPPLSTITSRKAELSIAEIERQCSHYAQFSAFFASTEIIRDELTPRQIARVALEKIFASSNPAVRES